MGGSNPGSIVDGDDSWSWFGGTKGGGVLDDRNAPPQSRMLQQDIDAELMQRQRERQQDPDAIFRQQQQQQQDNLNQQQQFEENVQSIFGIGSQPFEGSVNNNNVGTDPSAYDYAANSHDVNTGAFLTALSLNAAFFVVMIGGYELFRRWFPSVYSAPPPAAQKRRQRGPGNPSLTPPHAGGGDAVDGDAPAINVNTRRFLGWVPGVIGASWSTVRSRGGLDSYMFLRYVRLCFRITFTSALWGMIILWPVYATGEGEARGWYFLSMANLTQGSQRLWVPTVFIWLQTLYGEFRHGVFLYVLLVGAVVHGKIVLW